MNFRSKLRTVINDNSTKSGKLFDYIIQLLILMSLVAFALETLPDNSPEFINLLYNFEIFCFTKL